MTRMLPKLPKMRRSTLNQNILPHMKTTLSLLAVLGMVPLILMACYRSANTSIPSVALPVAEATPDVLQTWAKLYLDDQYLDFTDGLSPDGRWVISYKETQGMPIKIILADIPTRTIQLAANPEADVPSSGFPFWSPDSLAIASLASSIPSPRCGLDQVVIYRIVDQSSLEWNVFHLPDNRSMCPEASWNPDSSRLLVDDGDMIYILDRQARLVHQIPVIDPTQHPQSTSWAIWTSGGIFVAVDYDNGHPNELWRIDPDRLDEHQMLTTIDDSFRVMGVDPQARYVLLRSYVVNFKVVFRIVDLASGQVIHEIRKDGDMWDFFPSVPSRWIAFSMNEPEPSGPKHFYVFDWAALEFRDYTEKIKDPYNTNLVGWQARLNGFLFQYLGDAEEPYFEVVQP